MNVPARALRVFTVEMTIMVGGQTIQVGLAHVRKTAEVTVEAGTYQIAVKPGMTITAPRTTSRDIKRHKASNYQAGHLLRARQPRVKPDSLCR